MWHLLNDSHAGQHAAVMQCSPDRHEAVGLPLAGSKAGHCPQDDRLQAAFSVHLEWVPTWAKPGCTRTCTSATHEGGCQFQSKNAWSGAVVRLLESSCILSGLGQSVAPVARTPLMHMPGERNAKSCHMGEMPLSR